MKLAILLAWDKSLEIEGLAQSVQTNPLGGEKMQFGC